MNAVVSIKRRGRPPSPVPQLPVDYVDACKALERCQTLDETRHWDNKADALAAWARIYGHNEAARQARLLKLHAYRRMGQLAEEIRPGARVPGVGRSPGPKSLLLEKGLSPNQADAARKLSNMDARTYDAVLSRPRPPSPVTLRNQRVKGSQAWLTFCGSGTSNDNARAFRAFCRRNLPGLLAKGMKPEEASVARTIMVEIAEWIEEFQRYLPKSQSRG
jgi:hypothetical protein